MKKSAILLILVFLFASGAFGASGAAGLQAGDKTLRVGLALVDITGEANSLWPGWTGWYYTGHGWVDTGFDGAGVDLSFEYMVRDRIGVAVHVAHSTHLVGFRYQGSVDVPDLPFGIPSLLGPYALSHWGNLEMTPVLVGANYHLGGEGRLDFYFGPLAGYVFYSDVGFEWGSYYVPSTDSTEPYYHGAAVSVDDDFAYGVMAGLDVDFGKKGRGFLFTLSAKYLETEVHLSRVETRDTLSADPWSFQIGLGYRF